MNNANRTLLWEALRELWDSDVTACFEENSSAFSCNRKVLQLSNQKVKLIFPLLELSPHRYEFLIVHWTLPREHPHAFKLWKCEIWKYLLKFRSTLYNRLSHRYSDSDLKFHFFLSIFGFSPGALKLISANLNSHLSSSSVLSTRGECYQKMLPSNRARKFHNSESSTNAHWGGVCVCVWIYLATESLFIISISDTYYFHYYEVISISG